MENLKKYSGALDIEAVRRELQSEAYKERVKKAQKDIDSMYSHMVIDRDKLFIPVDF